MVTGRGAVRLAHLLWEQGVVGSNPTGPTMSYNAPMRRVPAILSSLLLVAHFLRDGNLIIALVCLGMPFSLIAPTTGRHRVFQVFLVVGAVVWAFTGLGILLDRLLNGQPWFRLVIIMGAVSAFTLWSAWLLPEEARTPAPSSSDLPDDSGTT